MGAQLVQPAVGQLHLRFDAHRPGEVGTLGPSAVDDVVEEGALPMPASPPRTSTPLWPASASVNSRSRTWHTARRPKSPIAHSLPRRPSRSPTEARPRWCG